MKNRLMILALAVTVLATVLLGCAKQEKNPTTEPDTTVSETTTQEETTAKSPGEALSEGASEAGSKVREGATDLSEAASRAGGDRIPCPGIKQKGKDLFIRTSPFFISEGAAA